MAALRVWKKENVKGIFKMNNDLLKFITCGSVDDGKSTLIGHMLYDAKLLLQTRNGLWSWIPELVPMLEGLITPFCWMD